MTSYWPSTRAFLAHGRHIFRNLEKWDGFANNHYLSNLVGLIYLGILCPMFQESTEWREVGLRELWREMLVQVNEDGTNFEASISYHRLACELYLGAVILCRHNEVAVPEEVMTRLEKMIEFVMQYTKPDGTAPCIGDSDNGRLLRLKAWSDADREWLDHRYLLAIGATLFNRRDFARIAGDQWEEAFWLLGLEAVSYKGLYDQEGTVVPALESQAFPDGGFYCLRTRDSYMIVDAGPQWAEWTGWARTQRCVEF